MPFPSGHIVTADEYALGQGDWIDYSGTFALTGSTTNPTKGNSTYLARYTYLTPHTVAVAIHITIGSTFTVGSGFYLYSLPVTPADLSGYGAVGGAWLFDTSPGPVYSCVCRFDSSSGKLLVQYSSQDGTTTSGHAISGGNQTNAAPFTPATGDEFRLSIIYEV